jgi:hypothetical protein
LYRVKHGSGFGGFGYSAYGIRAYTAYRKKLCGIKKMKSKTHNKNFVVKVKERKMVKKRGLASYILLSMITSGIYGMWRIHVLARDMNLMCEGDGKKTRGFLAVFFFGLITFGIAIVYLRI